MDTSNSKSSTNEPAQKPDPLALAAKAISSFQSATEDISDTMRNGAQNRWREAMLVTAYAQAAELRKQTDFLNSIESWLISIDERLEEANRAA